MASVGPLNVRIFHPEGTSAPRPEAPPLPNGVVPARGDFFEHLPNQPSGTLSFNPADRLFPGAERFDPLQYVVDHPEALPVHNLNDYRLLHAIREAQTEEAKAAALKLAEVGPASLWFEYLDQLRASSKLDPAMERFAPVLLKSVLETAAAACGIGKVLNNSLRPYQADPTLALQGNEPSGTSHPSGHATLAYAAATVLANLCPERADEFYRAAANVARSRMELGVHFPGDVAAGARLGVEVAFSAMSGWSNL